MGVTIIVKWKCIYLIDSILETLLDRLQNFDRNLILSGAEFYNIWDNIKIKKYINIL